MGNTVPKDNVGKIQFYEDHIALFNTNAVAIGTSVAEATALQTKITAARTSYTTQQATLLTAKNATQAANLAVEVMATAGAAIIKQVRAKAESTNNTNVYILAGLPVPTTPAAKAKPGTPFDFNATLNQDGSLELTWKCTNPTGTSTIYNVYRSSNGATNFAIVGGTGERKFVDDTIPAGLTQITYKIQAMRSTAKGNWATFNVFFGSNVGGNSVASVSPVKIAA